MIALGEKIVIDGIVPETRHRKLEKIQAEMQVKITGVSKLICCIDNAKAKESDVIKAFMTIHRGKGENIRKFKNLGNLLGEMGLSEEDSGPSFEFAPIGNLIDWYNSLARLSLSGEVMKYTILEHAKDSFSSIYNRENNTKNAEETTISKSKTNGDCYHSNFKKEEGLNKPATPNSNADLSELLSDEKKCNSKADLGDFSEEKRNYKIERVPSDTKKEKWDNDYDRLLGVIHGSGRNEESWAVELTRSQFFESHFRPTSVVEEYDRYQLDEGKSYEDLSDTFVAERTWNLVDEIKLDEELNDAFKIRRSRSNSQEVLTKTSYIAIEDLTGALYRQSKVTAVPAQNDEKWNLKDLADTDSNTTDNYQTTDSELDPEVLEVLTLKMKESLKRISKRVSLSESEDLKNALPSEDECKDIIVRYNTWRRQSLCGVTADTDIFEVWQAMGYDFKKFQKIERDKQPKKDIGYHVEEDSPWLEKVQTMRQKRTTTINQIVDSFEKKVKRRSTSHTV